ncbi:hypothetical protein NX059_004589 [Plenodomus lindquistii]|nr:hypothetical protein NX059_004589 [Plenodomus lindquistii]
MACHLDGAQLFVTAGALTYTAATYLTARSHRINVASLTEQLEHLIKQKDAIDSALHIARYKLAEQVQSNKDLRLELFEAYHTNDDLQHDLEDQRECMIKDLTNIKRSNDAMEEKAAKTAQTNQLYHRHLSDRLQSSEQARLVLQRQVDLHSARSQELTASETRREGEIAALKYRLQDAEERLSWLQGQLDDALKAKEGLQKLRADELAELKRELHQKAQEVTKLKEHYSHSVEEAVRQSRHDLRSEQQMQVSIWKKVRQTEHDAKQYEHAANKLGVELAEAKKQAALAEEALVVLTNNSATSENRNEYQQPDVRNPELVLQERVDELETKLYEAAKNTESSARENTQLRKRLVEIETKLNLTTLEHDKTISELQEFKIKSEVSRKLDQTIINTMKNAVRMAVIQGSHAEAEKDDAQLESNKLRKQLNVLQARLDAHSDPKEISAQHGKKGGAHTPYGSPSQYIIRRT